MGQFAEYEPSTGQVPLEVTVRDAVTSDLDAMVRVQLRSDRSPSPEVWRRAIADPDRCVLVAEHEEQVVGWAQTYHHTDPQDDAPPGHYLGGVTVDPAWRRRGVAVALTDARMRWIAERADVAFYVVNATNRASIELHRRWGFEEVTRAARLTGVEFTGGVGLLMHAGL